MRHAGNYVGQGRAIFYVTKTREPTEETSRSGWPVVHQELILTPVGGGDHHYYERKVTAARFKVEPVQPGQILEVEWHKSATGKGYYTSRVYEGILLD